MAQGFGKLILKLQQEQEAKILKKSVLKHFQHLQDPRVERTKDHSLVAIITIVILAVLSGADRLVLAQQEFDSKSNEITAVPKRAEVV